jgi:hypothetical protein
MRRLLLAFGLLLLGVAAGAQDFVRYYPPQLGTTSSGAFTLSGSLLLPDGTAAAPSLAFASSPTYGLYYLSGSINVSLAGNRYFIFDNSARFRVLSDTGAIMLGASSDVFLTRAAAATLQQGAADAAAPVNQTLQAQGVAAGTSDVAGGNYTFKPGVSRGNAVPGVLTLNRSLVTTTGNAAQAQQQGMVICGTKTLSNTSATAQTIATITTTTTTAGGVQMFYTVTASDATNVDADSGIVSVSWNNLAATVAATMSAVGIGSNSVVAPDTLAATPTATVATNVVSIKLTPTWTNTVPSLVTGYFTFLNNSGNAIVCQ